MSSKVRTWFSILKRFLLAGKRKWFLITFVLIIVLGVTIYLLMRPGVLPQPAIHLLDDIMLPGPGQVVLVFSPHPDDETISAGGYIAASVKEGATVKIVLITDGGKSPLNNTGNRYLEFKKATAILGVPETDLIFLGLPDGNLRKFDVEFLRETLRKQIDEYNPDFIIYPDSRDYHQDHSATGEIVQGLLDEDPLYRVSYAYLVHYKMFYPQPRRFDPDLYLLPPIDLIDFHTVWQRFMIPQEVQDIKQEAIYAYKSQLRDPVVRTLMLSSIRKNEIFTVYESPSSID